MILREFLEKFNDDVAVLDCEVVVDALTGELLVIDEVHVDDVDNLIVLKVAEPPNHIWEKE
jgi:hypothetical protein